MKKLFEYMPGKKPRLLATIKLEGNKVVFDPTDAPTKHTMLKTVVVKNKQVKPEAGKEYYEGLDTIHGTYYGIEGD